MSTSETITFNRGACPCGAGHIAQHVTTQDNPWSGADVSYSIKCVRCCREWRLDDSTLILLSSEVPYLAASKAQEAAAAPLRDLVTTLMTQHFTAFAGRTKKAEHAVLTELRVCKMSYKQYLEHRKRGGTMATAADPRRNAIWLERVAAAQGKLAEWRSLDEAHQAACEQKNVAYKQIVRKRVT